MSFLINRQNFGALWTGWTGSKQASKSVTVTLDSGDYSRVYPYHWMAETIHIGAAAKLAGVSIDTVRFYQKLGLIHVPVRSAGGYRLFDQEQIHNLQFVRHAQDLGFSLNEIRDLLALRQKSHACAEVQSMLKRKVADVREKIKSLAALETELAKELRNCERELRSKRAIKHKDCCPVLSKLDQVNGRNGNGRVSHGRTSAKD